MKRFIAVLMTLVLLVTASGFSGIMTVRADALYKSMLGDINRDGNINSIDALMALNYSVNKAVPTEAQAATADMNFDTVINSTDALIILLISVEKREQATASFVDFAWVNNRSINGTGTDWYMANDLLINEFFTVEKGD